MARGIQLVCCKNGCKAFEQNILSDALKQKELDPPLPMTVKAVSWAIWVWIFSTRQSNQYRYTHMPHSWQLFLAVFSYQGQRAPAHINTLGILGFCWCYGSVLAAFGFKPSRLLGHLVQFTFYPSSLFGLFLKPQDQPEMAISVGTKKWWNCFICWRLL